jgi:hypothetical protein
MFTRRNNRSEHRPNIFPVEMYNRVHDLLEGSLERGLEILHTSLDIGEYVVFVKCFSNGLDSKVDLEEDARSTSLVFVDQHRMPCF